LPSLYLLSSEKNRKEVGGEGEGRFQEGDLIPRKRGRIEKKGPGKRFPMVSLVSSKVKGKDTTKLLPRVKEGESFKREKSPTYLFYVHVGEKAKTSWRRNRGESREKRGLHFFSSFS